MVFLLPLMLLLSIISLEMKKSFFKIVEHIEVSAQAFLYSFLICVVFLSLGRNAYSTLIQRWTFTALSQRPYFLPPCSSGECRAEQVTQICTN